MGITTPFVLTKTSDGPSSLLPPRPLRTMGEGHRKGQSRMHGMFIDNSDSPPGAGCASCGAGYGKGGEAELDQSPNLLSSPAPGLCGLGGTVSLSDGTSRFAVCLTTRLFEGDIHRGRFGRCET